MSICYDSCKDIPAEEEQHMEEKNSNEKRQKKKSRQKRRYSRIGCYCFAIKKMWKLDRGFVFLIFAAFLPEVLRSLVADYFPGHLIDQISAGTAFRQLFFICAVFIGLNILLQLLQEFISARRQGRSYYPTNVYQTEMGARKNYEMDFENTFQQDFKEIAGYAWGDTVTRDCALEFFWRELSDGIYHLTAIAAYVSLLTVLNPALVAVVAVVSFISYFTSSWCPA